MQTFILFTLLDRACDRLTPWLNNPNGGATNDQRNLCNLPPRNSQNLGKTSPQR